MKKEKKLNEAIKNNKEKASKGINEFKKFITRGNVVDLSVGVVIGGAFGKIVSSLVDDIFMPVIGVLIGGIDFSNLSVTIGNVVIKYGSFIQQVIDFLIIALCIFIFIKIVNKLTHLRKEEEKPKKSDEVILLEEIRDLLKEKNKKSNKK